MKTNLSNQDVSPNSVLSESPGETWLEILHRQTLGQFSQAFAEEVLIEASVLPWPLFGVRKIHSFFETTKKMYDAVRFTSEAIVGPRTYLEWVGLFQGADVAGITVLEKDEAGAITSIHLHHRPYDAVLAFASDLAARMLLE